MKVLTNPQDKQTNKQTKLLDIIKVLKALVSLKFDHRFPKECSHTPVPPWNIF